MSTYSYKRLPIDSESCTIRLLTLYPVGYNGVRCTLTSVSLDDNPEYEALSYCWGNSVEKKIIDCNGKDLAITNTLAIGLSNFALPPPRPPRVLWVDQICINQDDNIERNHQVNMMDRIYCQSQRTLVYLGGFLVKSVPHLNWQKKGMELAPHLNMIHNAQVENKDTRTAYEMSSIARKRYGIPAFDGPEVEAFFRFFKVAWFERVWVLQELALAPEAKACYGGFSVDWDSFMDAAETLIFELGAGEAPTCPDFAAPFKIHATRTAHRQGGSLPPLLTLLARYRQFKATNPRDKVYSLRALAGDGPLLVSVDYDKPTREVYIETANRIIKSQQNLGILEIGRSISPPKVENLPSWVPDWSVEEETISLTQNEMQPLGEPGHEPGDEPPKMKEYRAAPQLKTRCELSDDNQVLQFKVMFLDTVKEVSTVRKNKIPLGPTADLETMTTQMKAFHEENEEWKDLARTSEATPYFTGENNREVYWQTVVAGNMPDGYKTTKRAFESFDAMLSQAHRFANLKVRDRLSPSMQMLLFRYYVPPKKIASAALFHARVSISVNRRLMRTEGGLIGLAHGESMHGDRVVLVRGSDVPLIIRPKDASWELVGGCYIHGIMEGKQFDEAQCQEILLV